MRTSPYKIGLTGNIATGKSTVGKMLVALGAGLLDADKVAHRVMAPDGRAYAPVVSVFGTGILGRDGTIDRPSLAKIVFTDAVALQRLESLVHPEVIAEVNRWIDESQAPVVVVEAIKLLESGMADTYDAIWVTTCSQSTQIERLMSTRGMSREMALKRVQAQPPQADKVARADVVIDTDCSLDVSRRRVAVAWDRTLPPDLRV